SANGPSRPTIGEAKDFTPARSRGEPCLPVHVCFAPKATELPGGSEMTRWASALNRCAIVRHPSLHSAERSAMAMSDCLPIPNGLQRLICQHSQWARGVTDDSPALYRHRL